MILLNICCVFYTFVIGAAHLASCRFVDCSKSVGREKRNHQLSTRWQCFVFAALLFFRMKQRVTTLSTFLMRDIWKWKFLSPIRNSQRVKNEEDEDWYFKSQREKKRSFKTFILIWISERFIKYFSVHFFLFELLI